MKKRNTVELTLVVMAAGMGSRFGGLKQLQPVGPHGELILDYSISDAKEQGFTQVIFIIKEENQDLFHEAIGEKVQQGMNVSYAYQKGTDLPLEKFKALGEERIKPWGTGQAVYAARKLIKTPFMVINADDFYGAETYEKMAHLLREIKPGQAAMVAFPVDKTLSENGSVSRGVCSLNDDGELMDLREHTKIFTSNDSIISQLDEGQVELNKETLVSMNVWGFLPEVLPKLEMELISFLEKIKDPIKEEFYLPEAVSSLISKKELRVFVEKTEETWYGVTYKADQNIIEKGILKLHELGKYKPLEEEKHHA